MLLLHVGTSRVAIQVAIIVMLTKMIFYPFPVPDTRERILMTFSVRAFGKNPIEDRRGIAPPDANSLQI
jgi:hypothetical protein